MNNRNKIIKIRSKSNSNNVLGHSNVDQYFKCSSSMKWKNKQEMRLPEGYWAWCIPKLSSRRRYERLQRRLETLREMEIQEQLSEYRQDGLASVRWWWRWRRWWWRPLKLGELDRKHESPTPLLRRFCCYRSWWALKKWETLEVYESGGKLYFYCFRTQPAAKSPVSHTSHTMWLMLILVSGGCFARKTP